MSRYFIYLAYNGVRYCGWQRQPNGISIQQCLEEVLSIVLRQTVAVVGAGRTDAGVHARMMVAHFDVSVAVENPLQLADKLNRMLPEDIAVYNIVAVKENAHARFDALLRTYKYYVTDKKDPFAYEWNCRISLRNMNFDRMNEACKVLFEYSDFTSFSKLHTDVKTNNCRIIEAGWNRYDKQDNQSDRMWVFTIAADRFLRNMVRAIVGTLTDVGRGKITVQDFRDIIEAKDRCRAGTSAPAGGLALVDIAYPDCIFIYDKKLK
ncbi:MAG: tRNA pseudouridine(38-40) synthase TruA [Tannerella sp.]|nr:tRNA pseudouridine(38-40) synthase TruA [Tannerella sp.]